MRAFRDSISAPGSLAKHESPSNMETESMDTERNPDSTLGMYLTDCLKTYKCKQMITFHIPQLYMNHRLRSFSLNVFHLVSVAIEEGYFDESWK